MKTTTTIFIRKVKKTFLLFLLSILSLNLFCQVDWTKHPDPVLETGPSGSWDQAWVGLPCVLLVDDTLRMWYSGWDDITGAVGYATSTDGGITWTKYDHNPVLDVGPAGSWDEKQVYYTTVLYHDFTYHMWYVGKNNSDPEAKGYATSPDGIRWTKYEGNPFDKDLTPGGVLFKDNLYHMWYNSSGTSYGTSDDGINWTKYEGNPVIAPGPSGSWDRPRLQPHSVIFDGQKFHLWYGGGEIFSWQIGYATSPDGINWTKFEGNPVLPKGPPGSFDASHTFFSSVIFDDINSLYKMWYQAGPGGIGYAESILTPAYFYLDENEVTIKCENCFPGDTGTVNGILYESVDRALLNQRRDQGADLTILCTSLVTEMDSLFWDMIEFNQDIGSWDVSNVTIMGGMFAGAESFNQDIGYWDVINVTEMWSMFEFARSFNQDLSGWCVEIITIEPGDFATDCPLQTDFYPKWGTCPSAVHINDIDNGGSLSPYPNPVNTFLTIETGISGLYDIEISSLNGRLLFQWEYEEPVIQLDLSSFEKGVYLITVRSKDSVTTRKIIKL